MHVHEIQNKDLQTSKTDTTKVDSNASNSMVSPHKRFNEYGGQHSGYQHKCLYIPLNSIHPRILSTSERVIIGLLRGRVGHIKHMPTVSFFQV